MPIEFKIKEGENLAELQIDAENTPGNKNIAFFVDTEDGNEFYFNVLGLRDILELAVFLNHKIGFDLIDTREVEKEIKKEEEINKTT
ncbi:hypothetical protein [Sphingobacterium mizutaii]|uniref:hypothetical protein n=1 Tax=Sphingobacterium mizutaii TaxID=1010 RepID=UPI00289ABFAC|nr:hypothetical protein [Sphingobacterium mizutaii]